MRFDIGKLLVAHFYGFFKDFPAGGFREAAGVVDRLGYGVAGNAQFIRNILDGNSFHMILLFQSPALYHVIMQMSTKNGAFEQFFCFCSASNPDIFGKMCAYATKFY